MLHVPSVCTPCCMLLGVVAQSLKLVKLSSHQLPTSLWRPKRLAQQCWIRLHSSSMLGQRTRITHSLQSLMVCIVPMMHDRSQHCWELLHPFAHHCQHGRNNSQSLRRVFRSKSSPLVTLTYPARLVGLFSAAEKKIITRFPAKEHFCVRKSLGDIFFNSGGQQLK